MKREYWEERRSAWQNALMEIARGLSQQSTLLNMLGSVAWGRYDGEPQPSELKDNVIFGVGFLQGVRYASMRAGRELNLQGARELETIHDRIRIAGKQ